MAVFPLIALWFRLARVIDIEPDIFARAARDGHQHIRGIGVTYCLSHRQEV